MKHDSEPAKATLLRYIDIAMPNGIRGPYVAEVEGIVDDIIDAAVFAVCADEQGALAGSGGSPAL